MFNKNIINSKVTLLTGAGASKALGFEDSVGLVEKLIKPITLSSKSRTKSEKQLFDLIYKYSYKQEQVLENIFGILDGLSSPIKADQLLDYNLNIIDQIPIIQSASNLENYIIGIIKEHFIEEIKYEKSATLYQPLFSLLQSFAFSKGLPIFTTNYDVSIENAASNLNIPILNGFNDDSIWSGRPIFDKDNFDKYKICLFKLHGSINWRNESEGVTERPLGCPVESESVLLYPTQTKNISKEPYLTNYDYFYECLRGSRMLIVIGYSYNDVIINNIIRKAKSVNPLQVININPQTISKDIIDYNIQNKFGDQKAIDELELLLKENLTEIPFQIDNNFFILQKGYKRSVANEITAYAMCDEYLKPDKLYINIFDDSDKLAYDFLNTRFLYRDGKPEVWLYIESDDRLRHIPSPATLYALNARYWHEQDIVDLEDKQEVEPLKAEVFDKEWAPKISDTKIRRVDYWPNNIKDMANQRFRWRALDDRHYIPNDSIKFKTDS